MNAVDITKLNLPRVRVGQYRRLVSSIGGVPDCRAGGRRFEPWLDQHSGS